MTSRPGAPPADDEGRPRQGGLSVEQRDGERDTRSMPPAARPVPRHDAPAWQRHERRRDQHVIRRLRRTLPHEVGGIRDLYPDPTTDRHELLRLGRAFAALWSKDLAPAGIVREAEEAWLTAW